ncbi:stalk domain-containing protein [Cohnella caldifontis]|uniref:stalk domain-containing protein n=1 Tax=Cohnella caldifontis TaxID=3027471 RepID=UPI0023EAC704|nr:stalk domain-containing protein [Cohnella sp. YIM B05605]
MRHTRNRNVRRPEQAGASTPAHAVSSPRTRNGIAPKVVLPLIAGMLVFSIPMQAPQLLVPSAHAAAAVTYKLVKNSETMVTAGVKHVTYSWVPSNASKSTEIMHVIQVDLNNPYVTLNTMIGKNGSVTARQSVSAMAKETQAVAGINGDVFNTSGDGAPIGAEIVSGQLLVSTSKLDGMYAFAVTKDRKPVIDNFSFEGAVTTGTGLTFPLAGINKSLFYADPDKANSHVNALYIYTNAWTASERPAGTGTKPTEALVVDGVVQEISVDKEIVTPVPANGYVLRGHGTAAKFITDNLPVGTPVSAQYSLKSLTTGQSYDPASFQMLIGGHTILLDQGKAAAFSRSISGVSGSAARARTAVGYSKDGSTAYLITVEETGGHQGVTLKTLQEMLVKLGVWKAVNLDGGGSTTMVARPLGETSVTLAHPTFYGTTQRLISNGIGVYTNAPKGDIKGITASGPATLFVGQEASYAIKGYDTYYNPIDPTGFTPEWSINNSVGTFQDGKLTAQKPGKATLTVKAGIASDTMDVEVVGQDQIERLTIDPSTTLLAPGSVISVPVKARLKDGRELTVPASSIQWEFKGFTASAKDGKLTVETVEDGAKAGFAIARYDGFGTAAILAPGTEKTLETFEKPSYAITFSGLPAETAGTVSMLGDVPGHENSQVLDLTYDFTNGTGSRFAYANLNEAGGGVPIDGSPSAMTLDVLGDSSMNYLRAEFKDSAGKQVLVDLARQIDWAGWKTIRVDLAGAGFKGPGKLTKLYVVNLEQDQDERALQGEVAFDNLKLQYPPKPFAAAKPTIVMKVGKSTATINGKSAKLPAAPFMIDNVNYLPLRFVTETLGAEIFWDNKEKRVTVLRGDTMLELWVGRSEVTVNGVRQKVLAAPILKNNSTYVPVRVVSEQLGQKVDWENKTKTITIH